MSLYYSTFPKLQNESPDTGLKSQIVLTTNTDGGQLNTEILMCNINDKYTYNMLL